MADLGVAHLALGQADGAAARRSAGCAGSCAHSSSNTGVSASETALPGPVRRDPPAVEDDRTADAGSRPAASVISRAASTIAANDVGVEAGAADQRAVDVGQREQLGGVVGLDAAAVEDPGRARPARDRGRRRARGRRRSPPAPARASRRGRCRSPRSARRRSRRRRAARVATARGPPGPGGAACARCRRPRAPPRSRRRTGSARSPASSAAGTFSASARSVSPNSSRRSECPRTTPWTSSSVSIGARHLAGERALGGVVHVLRVDLDARAARRVDHRPERGNGGQIATSTPSTEDTRGSSAWMNSSASATVLYIFQLPAMNGVREEPAHASASTPGSVLPSISSSDAPPPVERWVTWSARPKLVQRRGRVAAADDGRARRRRDRLGDRAGAAPRTARARTRPSGRSRTRCRPPRSSRGVGLPRSAGRCRGPSSRRARRRRRSSAPRRRRRSARRSPGRRAARASLPAPASSERARAGSTSSSAHSESPTGWPWAAKNGKHIAPPIRSVSASSQEARR